jgi:hypothetical protein
LGAVACFLYLVSRLCCDLRGGEPKVLRLCVLIRPRPQQLPKILLCRCSKKKKGKAGKEGSVLFSASQPHRGIKQPYQSLSLPTIFFLLAVSMALSPSSTRRQDVGPRDSPAANSPPPTSQVPSSPLVRSIHLRCLQFAVRLPCSDQIHRLSPN